MAIKEQVTPGDKALAACRAYVAAIERIRIITGKIGDALHLCPGTGDFDTDTEGEPLKRVHLRTVYGYHDAATNAAFRACPHCVLADELVQQRKAARSSLGAIKGQITKIGKTV